MNAPVTSKPSLSNVLNQITASDEENKNNVEIAARRARQTVFSSPMEQIKRGLHSVIVQGHATFRLAMVSSLMNSKMIDHMETANIGDLINFDMNALSEASTADKLRENFLLTPGDGAKKPITISFVEVLYNIDSTIIDALLTQLPKEALTKTGMKFEAFVNAVNSMEPQRPFGELLDDNFTSFKEKYIDKMADVADFRIAIKKEVYNEDKASASMEFYFHIMLNPMIYKEIVESDSFSPYLLNLWIYNSMTNSARRGVTIIDPQRVSDHRHRMLKLESVPPKVNDRGFALFGNGAPIFIPKELDNVKGFMAKANSCINEDGVFDKNMLIEES